MQSDSLWVTYTQPTDPAVREAAQQAATKKLAEDPEGFEQWRYNVLRAHEKARRKATEEVLRGLAQDLLGAPDDLGLQVHLVATDWKERILRQRYHKIVPKEWRMNDDNEGHEEHADDFAGGLPAVVELERGRSISIADFLMQLEGDELHTFFINFVEVLRSEQATAKVFEELLLERAQDTSTHQPDSTATTEPPSVDDGQSQGPSAVSQATQTLGTSFQRSGTGLEGPGSSAPPSQKD
jgi:hypothetical protein